MQIFDTHCHIADPAFDGDRANVIARMRAAGVVRANVVADPCEEIPNQENCRRIPSESADPQNSGFANSYPEKVFSLAEAHDFLCASVGVHPHNASRWSDEAENTIREYLKHPKRALLGEIGLDYHYDLSPRDAQREVFDRQLEMAYTLGVPVQLHIREAHGDTVDILRARRDRMPAGIMHCYTGSWESAKFYLDCGLYISLSGAVTFKNAPKLTEVARNLPADRILIETDCPYMSPTPLRGRRNEPAFIVHTLEKIAQIRGEDVETCAEQLYQNSLNALGVQNWKI